MAKPFLVLLAGLALTLTAARPGQASEGWHGSCDGADGNRYCLVSHDARYPNHRGGHDQVRITVRRDPSCDSLHILFEHDIALDRPVSLTIDGGPKIHFYTSRELTRLARDVDHGIAPAWGPPEFQAFYRQIETGAIPADQAATELVARFAHVKEPRRIGVACAAATKLMARLRAARHLVLEFFAEAPGPAQVYHWWRLDARAVTVPLSGLNGALDRLAPVPPAEAG